MCSTNHPNWVTFEDESSPLPSSQKPLQSPAASSGSVPRPNGLKLIVPSMSDSSWSFSSPLDSPQMHFSFNGSSCVPSNTPLCTPVRETPSTSSPFHYGPDGGPSLSHSFSNESTASLSSPTLEQSTPQSVGLHGTNPLDGLSSFSAFQDHSGHFSPFWADGRTESGSSSSDSDSGSGMPRFFIRTKDGYEPPQNRLQNSYSYICERLERLRAEAVDDREEDEDESSRVREARVSSLVERVKAEEVKGQASFVPQGLFRSQQRDGWALMLRIPERKNRMSSRQWGPIYLRLLPGGVLQMYYEKGLEKPFKEIQLHPYCRLSSPKLESYHEPRKIQTVRVEHVSYAERKRYHPKPEVMHEAEAEQLLKFGTTNHGDMEDLVASIEEELMRLPVISQQRRHYEEQELSLRIVDHLWVRLDKDGNLLERAAITHIYCLAFLNGAGDCFLALNDLQLLRRDPSYGSEEENEQTWMEIASYHFHRCVNKSEYQNSRLIKFSPPDACKVELVRYKTVSPVSSELPFSVKAVVTVQGAYVELQAFLNMSPSFSSSSGGTTDLPLPCENIHIQVPVPEDWVKVSSTVSLLKQKTLKVRMNRNACLGSVSAADSQPVMQVSIGTVKYENVYSAIVWRIDRLPAKNTAIDHPHSFCCKLELGSDQEIPTDWYPFVTMAFEVPEAVVSQSRVKSLGTESDIQPQKHVGTKAHYHCQPKLYISVIDDVIESVREVFLDEGVEERVLEELRQLWESKVMQSRAVEGFTKDTLNPSNFVLQLPANYAQTLHKPTASIVIPAGQNLQHFTAKAVSSNNSSGTLATFSLPPGVSYPVQIPAGVTLQTSSGHLYKVNVPVMVTQAPGGHRILSQPIQHVLEQREPSAPQRATATSTVLQTIPPPINDLYPPSESAGPPLRSAEPQPLACQQQLPLGQCASTELPVTQPPTVHKPVQPEAPPDSPNDSQFTLDGIEFSPQPIDMSPASSFIAQLTGLQEKAGQMQVLESGFGRREEADMNNGKEGSFHKAVASTGIVNLEHSEDSVQVNLRSSPSLEVTLMKDFSYNDLSDIVQLDGVCDSSSEEEQGAGGGEDDFLGMINAEALRALQDGEGSSDANSSSSDSDAAEDDVMPEEEEVRDPLNSGDDVSEQDIPDLFDTDNVVVCQYDKIHRSKNRWKFYLKDGVMCFGGKDYVFSKAVGEAEW
ncbi:stonin-1 [Arapaima gigas]